MSDETQVAHLSTFNTMVMPAVRVGEDAVLVLQASITTNRGVLHRGKRATRQLGTEWPCYTCRKRARHELE